jgi:hypothetical protein
MPRRVAAALQRPSRPRAAGQTGRARAAARPARPAGSGRPERSGPAARAARYRARLARRRAGAGLSARAVRRAGPGSRSGVRDGTGRQAAGGWRPRGLDRSEGRMVRPGTGRARDRAGVPDRSPGACPQRASVGARGGVAQSRARCRARRGRSAHSDAQPAVAARRRSQGGDRLALAAASRRRDAERRCHALAHRGGAERAGSRRGGSQSSPHGGACVRPAALAGFAVALSRRPHRQLAGRLAQGGLA